MKVTPKFHGVWYGIPMAIGVQAEIPETLVDKAASRPDLFTKPGRKHKQDGKDED